MRADGFVKDFDVINIGADTQTEIGRQCPRRRRPGGKVGVVIIDLKQHSNRRVLGVLIVTACFEIR